MSEPNCMILTKRHVLVGSGGRFPVCADIYDAVQLRQYARWLDPLSRVNSGHRWKFVWDGGRGGAPRDGGTIFQITPSSTFKKFYTFCKKVTCPDGRFPATGLIQVSDGSLFGTTSVGGIATCDAPVGCGTVFTVTPSGTLTTLHSFDQTDGYSPEALVQGAVGDTGQRAAAETTSLV